MKEPWSYCEIKLQLERDLNNKKNKIKIIKIIISSFVTKIDIYSCIHFVISQFFFKN